MDITDKIALVTGGSRGLGRAIGIALAEAGAHVAVNYKENRTAADDVVTAIQKLGRRAVAIGADVSSPEQVVSMFAAIGKDFGEVSILVNNAGVARGRKVEDVDLAVFDKAINVNLRSAFIVTAAALAAMREPHRSHRPEVHLYRDLASFVSSGLFSDAFYSRLAPKPRTNADRSWARRASPPHR